MWGSDICGEGAFKFRYFRTLTNPSAPQDFEYRGFFFDTE